MIDIKNAFGFISHNIIMAALKAVGVGDQYYNLIKDIYSNLKTFLLTSEGLSDLVHLICGVKQGSALSSIFFILIIDPTVRIIQSGRQGCHELTYANDMGVIEDLLSDMLESIRLL